MTAQSIELQGRLAILRQKAIDDTLTMEEMKEAITMMRGDRANAATRASNSSRKAMVKAAIPDADAMLDELGKI